MSHGNDPANEQASLGRHTLDLPAHNADGTLAVAFAPCSSQHYHQRRELVRARLRRDDGFLMGEAWGTRTCHASGSPHEPTYQPYILVDGQHYEGDRAMTVPEFEALPPASLLRAPG